MRIPIIVLAFVWLAYKTYSQFQGVALIGQPDKTLLALGLSLVVLLTPLNLYFETRKWVVFLPVPLNLRIAMKCVFAGMSSGFITPNGIGEFSGRYLVLPTSKREGAISATFMGSFVQACLTVGFGIVAILFLDFPHFGIQFPFERLLIFGTIALVMSLGMIVPKIRCHVKEFLSKVKERLRKLTFRQISEAFTWGLLRYTTFTIQVVIALYIFGFNGQLSHCFGLVAMLFLIQTYIPLSFGSELGVREVIAVFLFGSFMSFSVNAALATLSVWCANVLIPVVYGGLVLQNSAKNQITPSIE